MDAGADDLGSDTPRGHLHDAPASWEYNASARLLECPALHVDGTGFRVDGRTRWLHVLSDGSLTLRRLHRKRGRQAIGETGIIPRHGGVLIHDCRASCFVHDQCRHQLCGSHLLRDPAFIVDSNGFRRARLMRTLPRQSLNHRSLF